MGDLPPILVPVLALLAFLGNAGVTAVVAQQLKILFVDPHWPDGPQRVAIMQIINYGINLLLVMVIVVSTGVFRPEHVLYYLLIAGGQAVGSHLGFKSMKTDGRSVSGSGSEK